MGTEEEQARQRLITQIIEMSSEIFQKTRRGTANYLLPFDMRLLPSYALKKGMTLEQAREHLISYFKGEHDDF